MKTHSLILMKNIHVIPTDKPSRLYLTTKEYIFEKEYSLSTDECQNKHIYITSSDEEIKEGDWYWLEKIGKRGSESGAYKSAGLKASKLNTLASNCKKVILTTDQDLVKDGVQAIDNDFLEWFVKNPSCEWVEVVDDTLTVGEMYKLPLGVRNHKYKIIIPKEEQKQNLIDMMQDDEKLGLYEETLEEAAYEYAEPYRCPATNENEYCKHDIISAFINGAKWQLKQFTIEEQSVGHTIDELDKEYIKGFNEGSAYYIERMYSEEEVLKFTQTILMQYKFGNTDIEQMDLLRETFQLFKKK